MTLELGDAWPTILPSAISCTAASLSCHRLSCREGQDWKPSDLGFDLVIDTYWFYDIEQITLSLVFLGVQLGRWRWTIWESLPSPIVLTAVAFSALLSPSLESRSDESLHSLLFGCAWRLPWSLPASTLMGSIKTEGSPWSFLHCLTTGPLFEWIHLPKPWVPHLCSKEANEQWAVGGASAETLCNTFSSFSGFSRVQQVSQALKTL